MNLNSNNVGIIIPTKNRPDFVIRQLNYYSHVNYKGAIYIGDDSTDDNKTILLKAIEKLKSNIKINYQFLPGQNIEEVQKSLTEKVVEKYVSFCGDDDFFIPSSLLKCAEFLEFKSDYSVCHGKSYLFGIKEDALHGPLNFINSYKLLELVEDNPIKRFQEHLNNYWVSIFSVHRTEEFLNDLDQIANLALEPFRERTLSWLPLIRGKSKTLDCVFLLRQIHNRQYENVKRLKLIKNKYFSSDLQKSIIILTNNLVKDDLISKEAAFQMIEKAFLEIYFPKESLSNEKNIYLVKKFITILKLKNKNLYEFLKNIRNFLFKIHGGKILSITKLSKNDPITLHEIQKLNNFLTNSQF